MDLMILPYLENNTIQLKIYPGDFSPIGHAPACPECNNKRTFFSMLHYPLHLMKSWFCTDCSTHFGIAIAKKSPQEELDEINAILNKLKEKDK
jgi:hypothetical protein